MTIRPEPYHRGETPEYGVVLVLKDSETIGRWAVADMIARVFPTQRALARQLDKEWFKKLKFGPHPRDRLVYRGPTLVHYTTPPHAEGLGTEWGGFSPNEQPIRGLAMLTGEGPLPVKLIFVAVRLPPSLSDLTSAIIDEVRDDYLRRAERLRTLLRKARPGESIDLDDWSEM